MKSMKYIVFASTLLATIFLQAYVVEGVRTTLSVKGSNRSDIKDIFIEGCDKDPCSKPKYKILHMHLTGLKVF